MATVLVLGGDGAHAIWVGSWVALVLVPVLSRGGGGVCSSRRTFPPDPYPPPASARGQTCCQPPQERRRYQASCAAPSPTVQTNINWIFININRFVRVMAGAGELHMRTWACTASGRWRTCPDVLDRAMLVYSKRHTAPR
jgi:hypothetical protein